MSLSTFFPHKKVLITGHTGFKGTWLSAWLEVLGADVVGFSLAAEDCGNTRRALSNPQSGALSCFGDVCEFPAVQSVFTQHQPEIVFHMAAQSLVRQSYADPLTTFATNVMGTAHVLEAVRQTPSVRAVVVVTSDKCYENHEWPWGYRENDPVGGHDPYSASKGCAELVTAAYRRSYSSEGAAIATARAGNVIGGGDWAEDRIVPDIVRAIASNEPVVLRRPRAIRPWQHVLDPLHGYLKLAECLCEQPTAFAEPWNFGPAEPVPYTVHQLASAFTKVWGTGRIVVKEEGFAEHEANYLRLDCAKAHQQMGWQPALSIDESIKLTVDWYRAYNNVPATSRPMTIRQIEDFMSRIPAETTIPQQHAA